MTQNAIEGKFLTTLPEVIDHKITKSMGLIAETSMLSADKAIKDLVKKAEKMGCNAIVNFRLAGTSSAIVVYGDGVVVEEAPFNY